MSDCLLDSSLTEDLKAKCDVVCSLFEEAMRLDFAKIKENLPIFQFNGQNKRDEFTHKLWSIESVAILLKAFAVAYEYV